MSVTSIDFGRRCRCGIWGYTVNGLGRAAVTGLGTNSDAPNPYKYCNEGRGYAHDYRQT